VTASHEILLLPEIDSLQLYARVQVDVAAELVDGLPCRSVRVRVKAALRAALDKLQPTRGS
jgi:hypothetical protein